MHGWLKIHLNNYNIPDDHGKHPGHGAMEIIEAADSALYRARNTGRDQVAR